METFFRLAAVAALLSASAAVHATDYNFSYTFKDNKVVAGSFSGDAAGNLISNISNMVASYNERTLSLDTYRDATGLGTSIISIDGTNNSFKIYNSNIPETQTQFYGYNANYIFAVKSGYSIDSPMVFSNWHVTSSVPVAAVPEPETYAMMLAGLGVLGFMARRRQSL